MGEAGRQGPHFGVQYIVEVKAGVFIVEKEKNRFVQLGQEVETLFQAVWRLAFTDLSHFPLSSFITQQP